MTRMALLAALWAAWALINAVVFALYRSDKLRARRGEWRIPERTLLIGTWMMGGVGAYFAMHRYRHKTKHLRFLVSAPLSMAASLAVMAFLTMKLLGIL